MNRTPVTSFGHGEVWLSWTSSDRYKHHIGTTNRFYGTTDSPTLPVRSHSGGGWPVSVFCMCAYPFQYNYSEKNCGFKVSFPPVIVMLVMRRSLLFVEFRIFSGVSLLLRNFRRLQVTGFVFTVARRIVAFWYFPGRLTLQQAFVIWFWTTPWWINILFVRRSCIHMPSFWRYSSYSTPFSDMGLSPMSHKCRDFRDERIES